MLVKVTTAKHLKEYKLELSFNDGLCRTIDLKKHLDGPIYQPLKNVEYFKNFTLNRWTVEWENGADFAPEFLHKLALEQNPKSDKQLTSK